MSILDCGHEPSEHSNTTTGYGEDLAGRTYCYACCAERDKKDMIETGRATMYLVHHAGWKITKLRGITRALHDARLLLAAVARSSITADDLIKASEGAFSGRLSIKVEGDKITIGYCTGQYWCTEYRNAVCAVLASALWTYKRDHCMPEGALVHNQETGEMLRRYDGLRAGDWLRRRFAREFGRGVASRWFN